MAQTIEGKLISKMLYNRLNALGMIPNGVREMNVGESDYSEHLIQPWAIWLDYDLNPWDADIVKRVLRHKKGESRLIATVVVVFVIVAIYTIIAWTIQKHKIEKALRQRDMESKNSKHWRVSTPAAR